MLEYADLPQWSRMEFVESGPALDFIVHPDAIPCLQELNKVYLKKFGDFVDDGERWGFDGCLRRTEDKDGSMRFRISAPPFRVKTDRVCGECRGTKEREFGGRCMSCEGTGNEVDITWEKVLKVSESMSTLLDCFRLMVLGEKKTTSPRLQIMAPFTGTGERNFPVYGYYSPLFVNWLKSKRGFRSGPGYEDVSEAMISMWKAMDSIDGNLYPYDRGQFWFDCHDSGWLNIACPGDACGLHPAMSYVNPNSENGYDFSCHNMDNPVQQLVLMTALAKLEMHCREEIER